MFKRDKNKRLKENIKDKILYLVYHILGIVTVNVLYLTVPENNNELYLPEIIFTTLC